MALRHARSLERYEAQQRARDWTRRPLPIARHAVGVLGTGAMGGEIAAWLERCGLVVRGWSRRSPESFEQVLAQSEIVVCALAADGRDRRHPRRARVRAHAARRLRHQRRARAAHRRGGPDRRRPLGASQRRGARRPAPRAATGRRPALVGAGITITPHIAAQPSTETVADQFVASVRALQRGEPMLNEVDRARGY
jgi:phosphoglycerate dehydrogenase-like enzyme